MLEKELEELEVYGSSEKNTGEDKIVQYKFQVFLAYMMQLSNHYFLLFLLANAACFKHVCVF